MPEVKFVTQISGDAAVVQRLDKIADKLDNLGKSGTRSKTALERAMVDIGNSMKNVESQASTMGSSFSKIGSSLGGLSTVLAGFGIGAGIMGAVQVLKMGIGAAVGFESAFAGVRKTVNATEAEFQVLEKGIRQMAKDIPVAADELANIGAAAGQLGIKTQNILGFTRVMADLGVATNLSSEEAATSLARLANITKMPQDQFDELGATIVALGNNFATTESEIVAMSMRIAGAGNQIGLTNGQILGFATALSSLGIEAEAGGSAISKVFIEIASQVETGGKNLKTFAKVAGMTSAEFKTAFSEDAAQAVNSFIIGLGKMKDDGGSVLQVLADLGIEEVRMRDALLRASGAGDILTRALNLQGKAWSENTALQEEASRRYATTESQWQKFKNTLTEFAISLGDVVLPVLRVLIQVLGGIVEGITKATTEFINFIASIPEKLHIPTIEETNQRIEAMKKFQGLKFTESDFMEFVEKSPTEIAEMGKKIEDMEAKAKSLGFALNKEGRDLQEYTLWLQEVVNMSQKKIPSIKGLMGIEVDTKSMERATQLSKEEKEEIEKLTASAKNAAEPANELARQMGLLRKGGVDVNIVLAAYSDKLIDAVEKQKELGTHLDKTTVKLFNQAKAFRKPFEDAEKEVRKQEDLERAIEENLRRMKREGDEEVKAAAKKHIEDLKTAADIEKAIQDKVNDIKIQGLEIDRDKLDSVYARTKAEQKLLEEQKIHLDFEIKREKLRLEYEQLRQALNEKISKMAFNDPLTQETAQKAMADLSEAEQKAIEALAKLEGIEITKAHKNQYEDMIKEVRDGAGQVFDAMLSGGRNAFGSLLDWLKSFFFTQLRTLFQNSVEYFTSGAKDKDGKSKKWTSIFSGVFGGEGESFEFGNLFGQKEGSGFSLGDFLGGGEGGFFGSKEGGGGFLGSGTGGINGKGVGGIAGGLMMAGGMSLAQGGIMDMGNNSAGSWAKSVGGGAMTGFALAGPLGAAIGAAVGALAKGVTSLVDWAKGKTNVEAGTEEIGRDYGGIKISKDRYNQLVESFGFEKDSGALWGARGSVAASPQMLSEMFSEARKTGKTSQFMGKMNDWLTYTGPHGDASRALQVGELTGDYTKLNELWKESQYYQDLLNRGLKAQADAMQVGGDVTFEAAKSFETYFQEMKKTGEVTSEFTDFLEENRAKIVEAGKDYSIVAEDLATMDQVIANMTKNAAALGQVQGAKGFFTDLKTTLESFKPNMTLDRIFSAGLITEDQKNLIQSANNVFELSQYFTELTANALKSGEVLGDLSKIMEQFGGAADIALEGKRLKGIMDSISGIEEFRTGLGELSKTTTGLQDVLDGLWNDDVVKKLFVEGFDPGEFEGIAQLIGAMKEWDSAVQEYSSTEMLTSAGISAEGRKIIDAAKLTATQLLDVQNAIGGTQIKMTDAGQLIADMLRQYGGAEGQIAAENLLGGVNNVSDQLLATTKANMEAALEDSKDGLLGYLDDMESDLKDRATALQDVMQAEFDVVSSAIEEAFYTARDAAVGAIDEILAKLKEMNDALLFGEVSGAAATDATRTAVPRDAIAQTSDFYSSILQELLASGAATVTGTAVPRLDSGGTLEPVTPAGGQASTISIVNQFYGDIYGMDDLDSKVTEITARNMTSGVYRGV